MFTVRSHKNLKHHNSNQGPFECTRALSRVDSCKHFGLISMQGTNDSSLKPKEGAPNQRETINTINDDRLLTSVNLDYHVSNCKQFKVSRRNFIPVSNIFDEQSVMNLMEPKSARQCTMGP